MSVATITAKIGPGLTDTTTALTGVSRIDLDAINNTLEITCDQGRPIFDVKASTTFTLTVSSLVYSLTVS